MADDLLPAPQKIILFGATGHAGRVLLRTALSRGIKVTAFVRSKEKLLAQLGSDQNGIRAARSEKIQFGVQGVEGASPAPELEIVEGDARDPNAVGVALSKHTTLINASGNATDGVIFHQIFTNICASAEENLLFPRRVWTFGGVAALDVPGKNYMAVDCFGVPPAFRVHKQNYETLKDSSFDWSMVCPGPMVDEVPDREIKVLRLSAEVLPYDSAAIRALPKFLQGLALFTHLRSLTVAYQDVADTILDNLGPEGQFSRRRIGLALDPKVP